jgi:translation initiation factor 2B subunit (eIF-2B alpha/beta/delta family)
VLASALPDGATVLTIGWPAVAGAALLRRGDARVLCADSRHEASAFLRQLERADVECDPVPPESLARAAAISDVVLLEGVAACSGRVLAPIGSHVVAAVAADLGVPVWCALGIGRRLPAEYVDAIAERVVADTKSFDVDIDELPVGLVSHVATRDGVSSELGSALRPECSFTPELLRASPI